MQKECNKNVYIETLWRMKRLLFLIVLRKYMQMLRIPSPASYNCIKNPPTNPRTRSSEHTRNKNLNNTRTTPITL